MHSRHAEGQQYTASELARTARRVGNRRRGYLFVNPLQAKHMPVSPSAALAVMRTLGRRIASRNTDVHAIIGFAETATAIGACAASEAGDDVCYVQTTRETKRFSGSAEPWLDFSEEHSHAAEQRLYVKRLLQVLQKRGSGQLVLIDDEISTGRTCLDLLCHMRKAADLSTWDVSLAAFLSSCSPENLNRLQTAGVSLVSLAVLEDTDHESAAAAYDVSEPQALEAPSEDLPLFQRFRIDRLPDARLGVRSSEYERALDEMCRHAMDVLGEHASNGQRVLVLGTEECMYPALRLGECVEQSTKGDVRCHATTRSPIGVCTAPRYPLISGHRVHSFYDTDRSTYVYNEAPYDLLVVVSDTTEDPVPAMRDLQQLFPAECTILLEV